MKTKKNISILLTVSILTVLTISWVSAYKWDSSVQWPNYSEERHDEMTQAFETNDYEAWKNLMEWKWRVTEVVNAGNFERFSEANSLSQNWRTDEVNQIRNELWLWLKDWSNKWQWKSMNKWNNSWNKWQAKWQWQNKWTWDCLYVD